MGESDPRRPIIMDNETGSLDQWREAGPFTGDGVGLDGSQKLSFTPESDKTEKYSEIKNQGSHPGI